MRIAILTLPLHTNFGGILQCYALQTVLERMGHDVTVLNTNFKNVSCKVRAEIFIKRLVKTILRKESRFYGWKTDIEVTHQYTQAFIDKYIHIRNISDLFLLRDGEFDAIVVGSDQIWRPLYYQPIANAYLNFAKNWTSIKRMAYAASFGVDRWEYTPEETEECASLLKLFNAVSVRESSGIDLCRKNFEREAVQVLDPTLLLTKEDYESFTTLPIAKRQNGGLCYYFLDTTSDKLRLAKKIAEKHRLISYEAANNSDTEKYYLHFEKRIQKPIEQWLADLMDASFIVTDSFHGCVFSIIFNKPFIAVENVKRGIARLKSLLSMFGLDNRLISISDSSSIQQMQEIKWDNVNRILNENRESSLSFLREINN